MAQVIDFSIMRGRTYTAKYQEYYGLIPFTDEEQNESIRKQNAYFAKQYEIEMRTVVEAAKIALAEAETDLAEAEASLAKTEADLLRTICPEGCMLPCCYPF